MSIDVREIVKDETKGPTRSIYIVDSSVPVEISKATRAPEISVDRKWVETDVKVCTPEPMVTVPKEVNSDSFALDCNACPDLE